MKKQPFLIITIEKIDKKLLVEVAKNNSSVGMTFGVSLRKSLGTSLIKIFKILQREIGKII